MQKHYVTFLSPGTFVAEDNTMEIDLWDVEKALALSHTILQRHGARPYCFYFTTRGRGEQDLDSSEKKRSGKYYLGGIVRTYKQVCADNKPDEETLRWNMRTNNYKRIITTTNGYHWTQPLNDDDTVIENYQGGYNGTVD